MTDYIKRVCFFCYFFFVQCNQQRRNVRGNCRKRKNCKYRRPSGTGEKVHIFGTHVIKDGKRETEINRSIVMEKIPSTECRRSLRHNQISHELRLRIIKCDIHTVLVYIVERGA